MKRIKVNATQKSVQLLLTSQVMKSADNENIANVRIFKEVLIFTDYLSYFSLQLETILLVYCPRDYWMIAND